MDIAQQDRDDMKMLSPRIVCDLQNKVDTISQTKPPTVKRSFDVAFLMLPDEKLKNKRQHQHPDKQQRLSSDAIVTYPPQINVKSDENLRKLCDKRNDMMNGISLKNCSPNFFQMHNNNNDLIKNGRLLPHEFAFMSQDLSMGRLQDPPKSAFTKVPHASQQESPIPSISPEQLSCPSNSPPISSSPPQNPLYQQFRNGYQLMNGGPFHTTISQMQQLAQTEKLRKQFAYRPTQHASHNSELPNPSNYISGTFPFPNNGNSQPFGTQPAINGIVRNPAAAAALLTTLIPPTIATSFSLTAQNVCAKCNISFRMTSDLVYHMRSHHKSEYAGDFNRRKREDKLKCPVCNESFRERHHLTRHMTAHQDKESDETESIHASRRQK